MRRGGGGGGPAVVKPGSRRAGVVAGGGARHGARPRRPARAGGGRPLLRWRRLEEHELRRRRWEGGLARAANLQAVQGQLNGLRAVRGVEDGRLLHRGSGLAWCGCGDCEGGDGGREWIGAGCVEVLLCNVGLEMRLRVESGS